MTDCLIDGRPASDVPADDRGLLYGDSLFETIAFHRGQAPLWPWHWRRFSADAQRLGLPVPSSEITLSECRQLASNESCVIRVTLTRGSGGRAYTPHPDPEGRRIVKRRPWPDGLEQHRQGGLELVTSPVRLATDSMLAGIKHGNRLEQVMAARDCAERGADEAVLYDARGCLVEAIASNLVLVVAGKAVTPRAAGSGVAGVGLAWLQEQPGVLIDEAELKADDLLRAEEIMVINSVAGIRPVTAVDDHRFAIGATCRAWQRLWMERLEA